LWDASTSRVASGAASAQDTSRSEFSGGWRYYHATLNSLVQPIPVSTPNKNVEFDVEGIVDLDRTVGGPLTSPLKYEPPTSPIIANFGDRLATASAYHPFGYPGSCPLVRCLLAENAKRAASSRR
jgi:hypothetical protein